MVNTTIEKMASEKAELVQARVRHSVKKEAALQASVLGLSLSSVVCLLLTDFAKNGRLPSVSTFDEYSNETPNAETEAAFRELDNGGGFKAESVDEMFSKLGA